MKSKIIFALLLANAFAVAQELPGVASMSGFYKAGIRYGNAKEDSLYIRWANAVNADTFWVYKNGFSLEYITNGNIRTVWYNQPFRYERRMASHHLREFILESPLKFENLDELARTKNSIFLGKSILEYFTR